MKRTSILLICLTILFGFINQAFAEDCSPDGWCIQSSSQDFWNVPSLWGTAPDNVFAINYRFDVYNYDGTSWSKVIVADTGYQCFGIWGSSKNDIWIGGSYHYNGLTWSRIGHEDYGDREDYPEGRDVWGSSPTDVYAVGEGYLDFATGESKGVIWHYDGSLWTEVYVLSKSGSTFLGIWGSSASDIFAVANPGIIMHYNGSSWSAMNTGTNTQNDQFNGVWGTSPKNVYAVGLLGGIYHYNGSSWSEAFRAPQGLGFTSIWGSSANDVYAVGSQGTIYHFNGSSWSKKQMPDSGKYDWLFNVWGSSANDVFIAGQSGIYHYGGGSDNPDDGDNNSDNDGDGYTTAQGDCNDNDATIYAGAIEICGDGIDQDCNGSDLSCLNTDPPSAPTGVSASDGTLSGKVQVSWNASTGATSYDVYRAEIPAWAGGVPKRIATSVAGYTYDDTSAISGSQYYYWVKAKNSGGGSGYSMFNPGYWGTKGSISSAPTNVSASDGTVSGKVNITWNAVPNALVYEIYRADIPVYLGGSIKNIGTSTTTSYNDTTVVNGNQYYYWVKSRNSWGGSGYSKFDTGYIGTASPLLPAPIGVSATDGTVSGKVKLTWSATSGALIYEVYRATQPATLGGKPALMGTVKSPGLSYDDAAITYGTTYYYWVKARNSWGSSGYSKFDSGYCTGP